MSDFGIKISKPGYDVKTATAQQLQYSSKWSNFKIHSIVSNTVARAAGLGTSTGTIDNPLDYAPFFMPFVENTTYEAGYWYEAKSWNGIVDDGGATVLESVVYNPSTNKFDLTVQSFTDWDGGTFTFKVVVLVDVVTGSPGSIDTTGDFGVKASKDGQSIEDADSAMSFSSKFRNLTVQSSDIATTTNAGGNSVTVAHNLGYVPIVTAYQLLPINPAKTQRLPSYYGFSPMAAEVSLAYLKVSSSNLVITDQSYTGNPDIDYQYLIFNEQLTT